jgi:putative transposase
MSRGVDKRNIFQDDTDYFRFIQDLSIFNKTASTKNNARLTNTAKQLSTFARCSESDSKPLVALYLFCLMPNHYHILLSPLEEKGMARFLQKLNNGYVQSFNRRHDRKGVLFETRFKRIEVINDAHFIHLPYYIHSNPLDLFDYGWRKRKINNQEAAWEFLENYRWSSHSDYLGKENFPLVTQRDFLLDFFGGTNQYQIAFKQWLSDMRIPPNDIIIE